MLRASCRKWKLKLAEISLILRVCGDGGRHKNASDLLDICDDDNLRIGKGNTPGL